MLEKNGVNEEARQSRKENVKRHLLQRLSSPSIVRTYETGYNRTPEGQSDATSVISGGRARILGLQPKEAMGLSQPLIVLEKDYLALRHEQNLAWAQDRFDKGVNYAKSALQPTTTNKHALVRKAETCYKEGLEMIPHHVQILTAYGALCANDGRLEMAKKMLEKAILQNEDGHGDTSCHDDTIKDAKTYLAVVESKMHALKPKNAKRANSQVTLSNKAEKAVNDALAERAFVMGNDPKSLQSTAASKYQLLSSPSSESSISEDQRKSWRRRRKDQSERKKKKHRRKERSRSRRKDSHGDNHKRRKYRHKEEGNDEIEDDAYSSCSDAGRDRRKRHRRKDKRRRRRSSRNTRSRSRSRSRSD